MFITALYENCKYGTAATPCNVEARFVSGINSKYPCIKLVNNNDDDNNNNNNNNKREQRISYSSIGICGLRLNVFFLST
jgi:hypothetical protein